MTWLRETRWTSSLLVVVYLLTTTAASLFHNHSHSNHSHSDHLHSGHAECSHEHHGDDDPCDHDDHDHHGEVESLFAECSPLADEDDCAICRFLGLSSLPLSLPSLPATHELIATISSAEVRHEALPLELILHARAPPRLA